MANYYSVGRTNYFLVKDLEKFRQEINEIASSSGEIEIWDDESGENPNKVGLGFPDGIPNFMYNDDGEDVELNWVSIIGSHLEDDWVCVMQEIGSEKLRYLTGCSIAFNNKGVTDQISLNEIYESMEHLGKNFTTAEY